MTGRAAPKFNSLPGDVYGVGKGLSCFGGPGEGARDEAMA